MVSAAIDVLLVEDNPVDARLIRGLLDRNSPPINLRQAGRLAEAVHELEHEPADVVLLDLTLADSAGLETFRSLHRRFLSTPIVILTGREDEELALAAVQSGAQDYLLKGRVDAHALRTSLRYAIERKRAEEAVRELNEQLEERVAQRTRELSASNRQLEAFCHSVAHDLRAPLRAIDGFTAALEQSAGQLDPRSQDYLRRVRSSAQRMSELIDAMLELARVTRCPVHFDEVDLSAMAQEIAESLAASALGAKVDFCIRPGLRARGDRPLLWIVLENLLDNACKFSQRNPQPRVELGLTVGPEGRPVFFVRDNGVGFDMAYAEKLFRAFERLHGPEFEGLGIGLATVDRIVGRHGGRIWAESEPGHGSVFYFDLQPSTSESR